MDSQQNQRQIIEGISPAIAMLLRTVDDLSALVDALLPAVTAADAMLDMLPHGPGRDELAIRLEEARRARDLYMVRIGRKHDA